MKAIIAEKPSVAREIARVLGINQKGDGLLYGEGYQITWALGHLVGLALPEEYGMKGFDLKSLPVFPKPFKLRVREDSSAVKQLAVIKKVFDSCDSIIVATDAGREGELIFRYIYEYLRCKKPFQRLWISSLTDSAISTGLQTLRTGKDFDSLYFSARCRSQADWLVGINATQALSIKMNNGVTSLGRVQTPTLAMICQRFIDNTEFVPKPFFVVDLLIKKESGEFSLNSITKFSEKKDAERVLRICQKALIGTVVSVEVKGITENPPLLFDLTGLQKEANRKYSLTAEETLIIAQSLYEKKFITYPRTGSKYITEDMWSEIPKLVRALWETPKYKNACDQLKLGRLNRRIVNDLKVTDHHGLLPTEKIPTAIGTNELLVYDMIVIRMLEAVGTASSYEVTEINVDFDDHLFSTKIKRVIDLGWRGIAGNLDETDDFPIGDLSGIQKGDRLKIRDGKIVAKETKPPQLFTEATLLSAMEHAGRALQDSEERKVLSEVGIGTPATRASIIETLISRKYIKREKKALLPTERGLTVFGVIKEMDIANVRMTATWEMQLHEIELGNLDAQLFMENIQSFTAGITKSLLSLPLQGVVYPELKCPKCQTAAIAFQESFVGCQDVSCNWRQYRTVCGLRLDDQDLISLITDKSTRLIKGFKGKKQQFDARIVLLGEGKTSFDFSSKSRTTPPKKRS